MGVLGKARNRSGLRDVSWVTKRIGICLAPIIDPFGIGHLQCRNRDSAVRSRDIAGSRHVPRNRRIAANRCIPTNGRIADNREVLLDLNVCIHEVLIIGIILAKDGKTAPRDLIETPENDRTRSNIALVWPKIWRQIQRPTNGLIHLRFDFGHKRGTLGILACEFRNDKESKHGHTP